MHRDVVGSNRREDGRPVSVRERRINQPRRLSKAASGFAEEDVAKFEGKYAFVEVGPRFFDYLFAI